MTDLEKRIIWSEREDKSITPIDFYNKYYFGATRDEVIKADRLFYIILSYNKLSSLLPLYKNEKIHNETAEIKKPKMLINLISEQKVSEIGKVLEPKRDIRIKINLILKDNKNYITENYITEKSEKVIIPKILINLIRGKVNEIIVENEEILEPKKVIRMQINLAPKYALNVSKTPWKRDPATYYQKNYQDMTRKELEEANPRFYKYLWRHKLLDIVPKKSLDGVNEILSAAGKKNSKFGENPLVYYNEHYPGMSRGELKEKDSGLYQRLRRDGLLNRLPMNIQTNKYSDPLEYYQKNHHGLTRGELKEKCKGLYERLREDRLLEKVPL